MKMFIRVCDCALSERMTYTFCSKNCYHIYTELLVGQGSVSCCYVLFWFFTVFVLSRFSCSLLNTGKSVCVSGMCLLRVCVSVCAIAFTLYILNVMASRRGVLSPAQHGTPLVPIHQPLVCAPLKTSPWPSSRQCVADLFGLVIEASRLAGFPVAIRLYNAKVFFICYLLVFVYYALFFRHLRCNYRNGCCGSNDKRRSTLN